MGHPKALWVLGKEPGVDTCHSKGIISCGKRPDMQKTAAVETRGREQQLHKVLETQSPPREAKGHCKPRSPEDISEPDC